MRDEDGGARRSIRYQVERVLGLFDAVEEGRVPSRPLASEIDVLERLLERASERARDRGARVGV